jgi:NADPH:quinone reductase-like Zn-dependent oxidoreductase
MRHLRRVERRSTGVWRMHLGRFTRLGGMRESRTRDGGTGSLGSAATVRRSPGSCRNYRDTSEIPVILQAVTLHETGERPAMKAVRIHEYGGPEQLKFEDGVPEPAVTEDTVLIEAVAASVNPIDWKIRSGARQKDFPLPLPAILGRDVSGIVRAVGSNVHNFKLGDRALAFTNATYAELVAVESNLVTHLPDGVDLIDASAIPLASLTGDQLVRLNTKVKSGETILVSGALGSVGRAAVHSAKKLGARVIAGVRKKQLGEAAALAGAGVLAIDDDDAIAKLGTIDAVADTVGGETAVKLLAKVRDGGSFGYASVLPEAAKALYPAVEIKRVFGRADPSKVREFADDIRDGKFSLSISCRMPLKDAAEAHRLGEKGGIGKIILLVK